MEKLFDSFPLLQAAAGTAAAAGSSTGQLLSTFLTFGVVILIFYFLIIRPQSKQKKEAKKMLEALKKGDRIVTIGGVHGVIANVKENTVIVKVDDNVKLEFSRSAIASVVNPKDTKDGKETKNAKALPDSDVAENAPVEEKLEAAKK
jgi:preprotein translocase subunit YajC